MKNLYIFVLLTVTLSNVYAQSSSFECRFDTIKDLPLIRIWGHDGSKLVALETIIYNDYLSRNAALAVCDVEAKKLYIQKGPFYIETGSNQNGIEGTVNGFALFSTKESVPISESLTSVYWNISDILKAGAKIISDILKPVAIKQK